MIGGLKTTRRYLLAGASLIGMLAIGLPEAKARDLKAILLLGKPLIVARMQQSHPKTRLSPDCHKPVIAPEIER